MQTQTESDFYRQLPRGYRIDSQYGVIYDAVPDQAEDLTVLHGVDTREAVILNRLGVYLLPQIALWGARECASFAAELGMSPTALNREQWVRQAREACTAPLPRIEPTVHRSAIPASFLRTVSLLACALVVGCLFVYWLSLRAASPLRGHLYARTTTLRVPVDAQCLECLVEVGDEVFTGDHLLRLEKSEYLSLIRAQEQVVAELQAEFDRAEAQASLDLDWRLRDVEKELAEVRRRAVLIQEVKRNSAEPFRSASLKSLEIIPDHSSATELLPDSRVNTDVRPSRPTAANTLFFACSSGRTVSSISRLSPSVPVAEATGLRIPGIPANPVASSKTLTAKTVSSNGADGLLSEEAVSVQQRLASLESIRDSLPDRVRTATGVESLRSELSSATERLQQMKSVSREVSLVSPSYGRIGQVCCAVGDLLSAGDMLLTVVETESRYVQLQVPTRRVHELRSGTELDVVFPGHGIYRGRVSSVPILTEASSDGLNMASVRVQAVGRLWPDVPIGSEVDVLPRR
ncbi:MAG: hypothetical protein R3C49_11910 [Planctomycetaceae bacterium]